jgi:hypothetical protein
MEQASEGRPQTPARLQGVTLRRIWDFRPPQARLCEEDEGVLRHFQAMDQQPKRAAMVMSL